MSHLNKTKLTITVMMNVLLISLFIGFFFFTYGSIIEHKIVESQMKFLSDDLVNVIRLFGKNINSIVKEKLLQMKPPNLSKADSMAKENNKQIMIKALGANIVFTIIVVSSIYFLYKKSKKDFSMKTLIYQNLILLVFIALTEFSFLTFFAADYVSINTNNVKYNLIENVQELDKK
jgi:hypothetical protein